MGPTRRATCRFAALPARNSSTALQNSCGACSNIQWPRARNHRGLRAGTCSASARCIAANARVVSAPPMNSVGVPIDSASAPSKRLTVFADLSDQREGIVAQLLLWCSGQPCPAAVAIDSVEETLQPAVDVAVLTFSAEAAMPAARCEGPGARPGERSNRVRRQVRPGSACAAIPDVVPRRERRGVRRANVPSNPLVPKRASR